MINYSGYKGIALRINILMPTKLVSKESILICIRSHQNSAQNQLDQLDVAYI